MMNFIARLQQKPLNVRKRILFVSTILITTIIVVVYFSVTYTINGANPDSSESVSPFASIQDVFANVKNAFSVEKQVLQKNLKF